MKIAWIFYDRPDYISGPLVNARRDRGLKDSGKFSGVLVKPGS